jgi:hypothetical protein
LHFHWKCHAPGTSKNNCMSGDPTYRIFDELSFYRFSVTQPDRLAFFLKTFCFRLI